MFTLLKSKKIGNYGLYDGEKLVANYSHNDDQDYINDQVSRWTKSDEAVVERECDGTIPDTLEPKAAAVKPKAKPKASLKKADLEA